MHTNGRRRLVAEQERRFRRACEQIVQLNYKLYYAQKKYNKAKKDRRLALRYSYLLQIVAVESFRELVYVYAKRKLELSKTWKGRWNNFCRAFFSCKRSF